MDLTLPFVVWILMLASWMWGRYQMRDEAINNTLNYLIDSGYLKHHTDENGEIVLEKSDKS